MVVITAVAIISGGPDSIGYARHRVLTSFSLSLNISTMYIILHIKIIKKT